MYCAQTLHVFHVKYQVHSSILPGNQNIAWLDSKAQSWEYHLTLLVRSKTKNKNILHNDRTDTTNRMGIFFSFILWGWFCFKFISSFPEMVIMGISTVLNEYSTTSQKRFVLMTSKEHYMEYYNIASWQKCFCCE